MPHSRTVRKKWRPGTFGQTRDYLRLHSPCCTPHVVKPPPSPVKSQLRLIPPIYLSLPPLIHTAATAL